MADRTLPGSDMIRAQDLVVCHGRVPALHGLSLRVPAGRLVSVIGANGAGKTTLLSALMGLLPFTGSLAFPGRPGALRSVEARVRHGICLVPESRDLFGSMPVEDNLRLGGFIHRNAPGYRAEAALAEIFALFPRLAERRRQRAATLSGGERQMLALGRALMAKPALLMLDEPSLGLAPLVTREILAAIAGLRDRGMTILLVEQNARAALAISDYAYVMETGSVVIEGPAATVARNPAVVDSFLGEQRAAALPDSCSSVA